MFLHFGDLTRGLFGSKRYLPLLSQYIADAPGPVILSISQKESGNKIQLTPEAVADAMSYIQLSRKPVFIKVATAPNPSRTSVEEAVTDAIWQINTITDLFIGYNIPNQLAGFALNNIYFGELFENESRWTTSHVNEIITAIHGKNKSVMLMTDPALSSLSKFNLSTPFVENPALNNFLSTSSLLGSNQAITDYILYVNILYPWHLYESQYPELIFDLSRTVATISIMKTYQRQRLVHLCHQGHPQSPYPDYFQAKYDSMLGVMTTDLHRNRIMKSAAFIEACGIVDYTMTHDTSYGAISGVALHPLSYRGTNRSAFYTDVSITSRNSIISVKRNSMGLVRNFDSTLREMILEDV